MSLPAPECGHPPAGGTGAAGRLLQRQSPVRDRGTGGPGPHGTASAGWRVLGDMGELGDLTDQAHFNAGALAAMLGIDFVIAIGSKAARIADGAAMSGGDVDAFRHEGGGAPHGAGAAAAQHQYAHQGVTLHAALSG